MTGELEGLEQMGIGFEVVDDTSCQQETVSLWGVSERGRSQSQIMYVRYVAHPRVAWTF